MKNLGMLLLSIWLIASGLKAVINLGFQYDYMVLGVLGIVAGVLLLLKR
jgi:hypothetical protein